MASTGNLRRRLAPLAMAAAVAGLANPGVSGPFPGSGGQQVSLRYVQGGCRILGPFATMRRANEVASEARGYGYSALAFHNGDGYYVRAC